MIFWNSVFLRGVGDVCDVALWFVPAFCDSLAEL